MDRSRSPVRQYRSRAEEFGNRWEPPVHDARERLDRNHRRVSPPGNRDNNTRRGRDLRDERPDRSRRESSRERHSQHRHRRTFGRDRIDPEFENRDRDRSLDRSRSSFQERDRCSPILPDRRRLDDESDREESYLETIERNEIPRTFPPPENELTWREQQLQVEKDLNAESHHSGDRLGRLEKLVELLVANKAVSQEIASREAASGSTMPTGEIPELIPRNNHFTTSMWLNTIEEECMERNYDEQTSIQFMQSRMTGIIKAWFKTVSSYDFTWPELKLLITKTFPDNVDFAATLRNLVNREKLPDETMTQYYFSKMYLLEACKISGVNAVSCLIDGLPNPFLKQEAKSCNFLTPESLYSEFLLKVPDWESKKTHSDREVIQYEDPPLVENISNDVDKKGLKNMRCYTCDQIGHIAAQCRYSSCYICNKKGHISSDCRYKNEAMLCYEKGEPLDLKSCWVNGHLVKGYVDSGSNFITLKESYAKEMRLRIKHTKVILTGFGGATVKPIGSSEAKVKVGLVERNVSLMVVPDNAQEMALIIGRPLMFRNDVCVIFEKGNVYFNNFPSAENN